MQTTESLSQSARDVGRRIRDLFDAANMPSLRGVRVEVKADYTVLAGKVGSFYQKQMATELARRVPGVQRVVNLLEVPCYQCDDS